jgi:hypothetical protein
LCFNLRKDLQWMIRSLSRWKDVLKEWGASGRSLPLDFTLKHAWEERVCASLSSSFSLILI